MSILHRVRVVTLKNDNFVVELIWTGILYERPHRKTFCYQISAIVVYIFYFKGNFVNAKKDLESFFFTDEAYFLEFYFSSKLNFSNFLKTSFLFKKWANDNLVYV